MKKFTKYHFRGQKPEEKVLLVLHRHWFDILSEFFLLFMVLFMLFGSFFYIPQMFPEFRQGQPGMLFLFLENLFFMFLWMSFFLVWVDYYFDVWIVTNQRIINIEQKGLFSRAVSELELDKIQDMTTDVKGVIPTFLNYGDLYIQSAAEKVRFIFHNIPDPYEVKNTVMHLYRKCESGEQHQTGELIKKKSYYE